MPKLIRFDWAAKHILRNKANFDILEGFLSELFKQDIKVLRLLESETNKDTEDDKLSRFDLLVENDKKELLLIEIQHQRQFDYFHCMLFGTSRLVTEHLEQGMDYSQIRKIIAIHIVYFDLGQGEDYLYHGTTTFKGMHNQDILQLSIGQQELFPYVQVHEIFPEYYLIRVEHYHDLINDRFDEWVYFLKHEEIKDEFTARSIRTAKKKLSVLKLDKPSRKAYEHYLDTLRHERSVFSTAHHEGRMEGRMEGRVEGRQEGRQEGSLLTARNALLTVLEEKFGSVPSKIRTQIQSTDDTERLKTWLVEAIKAQSLTVLRF